MELLSGKPCARSFSTRVLTRRSPAASPHDQRSRRRSRPLLIGRTGRSVAAPELGLRFAGFRATLPAALGLSPGLPEGCGRDEPGLDEEYGFAAGVRVVAVLVAGVLGVGVLVVAVLFVDVLVAGVAAAAVLPAGVAGSASFGTERLRSPRVWPVR